VHYQELGNIEAAEVLGIGVEALESLLARGRRTLREKLAEPQSQGGRS
jgi:RNA polymerase sigma-70 factor (ECF subfamily)